MTSPRTITIHGREYETVASRIQRARADHPTWAIIPEILHRDDAHVLMRATISEGSSVIAVGHAEEYRGSSSINKTSAVENCETSAIGRALAAAGYIGSEFASLEEVANAIAQKPGIRAKPKSEPKSEPKPEPKPEPKGPTEGLLVAGRLQKVVSKEGQTGARKWVRYGLLIVSPVGDERWLDTFSSDLGAQAQQMLNMDVTVTYEAGERGPRATAITETIPF